MNENELNLDETTYYSVLGLGFDTTESQIRKSYMRLARELHPDKSKSRKAAELFKIVAHAHSVLTDKEKRLKYNEELIIKGLHTYFPKDASKLHEARNKTNTSGCRNYFSTLGGKEIRVHKAAKPYEEQPYGFGVEEEGMCSGDWRNSSNKSKKTKSFNLKSYQHQRRSNKAPEEVDKEEKKSSTFSARFTHSAAAETSKESTPLVDESPAKKMPKKESSYDSGSPFMSSDHRHYARTKFEAVQRYRRSTSPVKKMTTSQKNNLNGLKDIIHKLSFEQEEGESLLQFSSESLSSHDTPTHNSDPNKGQIYLKNKTKITHPTEFGLEALNESLPQQLEFFNMQNVRDTLDTLNVKRQKLSKNSSLPLQYALRTSQQPPYLSDSGNLTDPVNKPIPRIYKMDVIPYYEYMMDPTLSNIDIPPMPNFQCNILNKAEIEACKEQILTFNNTANQIKQKLITILFQRTRADLLLNDRVMRIENTSAYTKSKNYDVEVVAKLHAIQNRQKIVSESFTNLMKTVYATGTF